MEEPNQRILKLHCDVAMGDNSAYVAVVARYQRGELVFANSKKVDTNIHVQVDAKTICWANTFGQPLEHLRYKNKEWLQNMH